MEAAGRIIDVSRLLSRLYRRTPTGIDRVEFAYARHYLGDPRRVARCVVTTPVATGLLSPGMAQKLIALGQARWGSPAHAQGAAWAQLREIIAAPLHASPSHRVINAVAAGDRTDVAAGALIGRAYLEATLNRFSARALEPIGRAWYLHVSHANLHAPGRLRWVDPRRWRGMFLLHDLIPLSHPEYFPRGEDVRHRRRMQTVAQHARLVVFNSRATQAAWDAFARDAGLPRPEEIVVPLGIEDAFLQSRPASPLPDGVPYFVVVGTIEARKNLSFLLHVWKQWVSGGDANARLIVVGRRRAGQSAIDLLERSVSLQASVVEVQELADAGLATLLRGARALLAPSLIEGFGLPIAEALALGVPVIASDMPAHREVGGGCAEYLDPLDGSAWLQAIKDYAAPSSQRRETAIAAVRTYRPQSWERHIETVETFLKG